jgi:hypothetical protein
MRRGIVALVFRCTVVAQSGHHHPTRCPRVAWLMPNVLDRMNDAYRVRLLDAIDSVAPQSVPTTECSSQRRGRESLGGGAIPSNPRVTVPAREGERSVDRSVFVQSDSRVPTLRRAAAGRRR